MAHRLYGERPEATMPRPPAPGCCSPHLDADPRTDRVAGEHKAAPRVFLVQGRQKVHLVLDLLRDVHRRHLPVAWQHRVAGVLHCVGLATQATAARRR